jgi:hypothetical protein
MERGEHDSESQALGTRHRTSRRIRPAGLGCFIFWGNIHWLVSLGVDCRWRMASAFGSEIILQDNYMIRPSISREHAASICDWVSRPGFPSWSSFREMKSEPVSESECGCIPRDPIGSIPDGSASIPRDHSETFGLQPSKYSDPIRVAWKETTRTSRGWQPAITSFFEFGV